MKEKTKELKDSKEWKNTSEALIKLQKDWKNLGHVQYKLDQKLWNEFRSTCDDFFNSKKEYYDTLDERQAEYFKQKEDISAKIAKTKIEYSLKDIESFIAELINKNRVYEGNILVSCLIKKLITSYVFK